MKYKNFLGSKANFESDIYGKLSVESASFTDAIDGDLVVYFKQLNEKEYPLVRVHSECVFAEVLKSNFCDCDIQLQTVLEKMKEEGGILFYLRMDGRGAGLSAKVAATKLEVEGVDTYESRLKIGVPPEGRNFSTIGNFLKNKGFKKIRLMTNNPNKIQDIAQAGIEVIIEPLIVKTNNKCIHDLYKTKADKFNHDISKDFYE